MSDNIIPFRQRKPTKPKRPIPEWRRRLLIAAVIAAVLVATFLYFYLTGPSQGLI